VHDLRYRLNKFVQDFGHLPIAGITLDELDQECETCPIALRCASAGRCAQERLICFEKLVPVLGLLALLIHALM
jgi:hypothetical protein